MGHRVVVQIILSSKEWGVTKWQVQKSPLTRYGMPRKCQLAVSSAWKVCNFLKGMFWFWPKAPAVQPGVFSSPSESCSSTSAAESWLRLGLPWQGHDWGITSPKDPSGVWKETHFPCRPTRLSCNLANITFLPFKKQKFWDFTYCQQHGYIGWADLLGFWFLLKVNCMV